MQYNKTGKITDTAAVILAGGKSRRMGKDKMLLKIGDESVLQNIISRFSIGFEKIYVSVADANKYPEVKEEKILDSFSDIGPLAGLHAALNKIKSESNISGVFLTAADLPYVTPEDAKNVIEQSVGYDICVPIDTRGRFEPLFAYYSKEILPKLQEFLESGEKKVINFYPMVNIKTIDVSEFDSKHFYNLNFPEDYDQLINASEE